MKPRLLLVMTAYNGKDFVPRSIGSATRVDDTECDVDILVLDDCSPEPGFSQTIRALCGSLGVQYYRSPRNLGIPRNVNLGLLRALAGGYTYVVISNSDVIYPANLASGLAGVAASDPRIGSVMAWSNNVSVYSLPCVAPDEYLADQATVDWISGSLTAEFGAEVVDTPSGISFCILIPTAALPKVGLMDPVFGRGYCEEVDWSLRSQNRGLRTTVAPSVFVYHMGAGTNVGAGLVAAGHVTVPAHEKIIDMRYPRFRADLKEFRAHNPIHDMGDRAVARLVRDAAAEWGWVLAPAPRGPLAGDNAVLCSLVGSKARSAAIAWRGFRMELQLNGESPSAVLTDFFGRPQGAAPVAQPPTPPLRAPQFDTIYPEHV